MYLDVSFGILELLSMIFDLWDFLNVLQKQNGSEFIRGSNLTYSTI